MAATKSLDQALADWLSSGGRAVGQVRIAACDGGWELRHEADADVPADELETHVDASDARAIALADASGKYRPLKSAPTLRRGWRMCVSAIGDVRRALDFIYPAAIGSRVRFAAGAAVPVPLRETLDRQTGMYRIAASLSDDEAADVVRATCDFATKCRRRIAWHLTPVQPLTGMTAEKMDCSPSGGEWPILCLEGCNWLVAAARVAAKRSKTR